MAEEASGLLSPERNESIFRNDILRDYLPDSMGRTTHPRLILLGGQPGAGKSAVLSVSEAELSQSGPTIRIVGDDLRSYHPQFLAFQRQDPETASTYTQMDAGRWTERLLAAAAERQVNIVFETTLRTPENVTRVIRMARDAGYAVEVRAVAVNPRLSWQGTHYRFEEMLHAGQAARIPPQRVHDAAVDGLRVTLDMLERERLVDRVQLRTRSGVVIYDNEVRDGQWSRTPASRETLEREQSQPMTRGELQRFADDWHHVLGRMEERNAPADRIAAVEARAAEDVAQLFTRRREADSAQGQRSRNIQRSSEDAHSLLAEFYDNAVRDAERRAIGSVATHAIGRLAQTYTALRLVETARDLGLLPNDGSIVATRAFEREKRATREFPAAHRLPADLVVEAPDGTRRRLTEYFGVAYNREAIDHEVLSSTDRMSRLANVLDSWLEAAGMRKAFAQAIDSVAEGYVTVNEAMTWIVEPGYAAAVQKTRQRLDRNIALAERVALATTIVDARGQPFRAMRSDLQLRTANLDSRARAIAMMGTVLAETARHAHLDPELRRQADAFAQGIAERERQLRLRFDHRPDREVTSARAEALVPARHLPDLADGAISERLGKSTILAHKRAEIENLSRLVFGNSGAVSASLTRITDGRTGLMASVEIYDGRFGDMAGRGRTLLRGPSPERQTAEAHAPKLAAALADYGLAMEFERHQIVARHRDEQARQRVEVPSPSPRLSQVLAAAPNEQVQRMNAEPTLRREMESLTLAITKRLSPAERADLRDGNAARLASSLRISQQQVAKLRLALESSKALQERVMRQNRELTRGNQVGIRR